MSKMEQRDAEARRAAQALWDKSQQQTAEVLKDKEKARQADALKTARLRELRLAKAAAEEREAAANATVKKSAAVGRKSGKSPKA